jgi:hypothetical protein
MAVWRSCSGYTFPTTYSFFFLAAFFFSVVCAFPSASLSDYRSLA